MIRKRSQVSALAGLLIVAGSALFYYKAIHLGLPLKPDGEADVWTVEARVGFRAVAGRPIKATLKLPKRPPRFGILNENFLSRGYGLNTVDSDQGREAQWAIRRARGAQALYYRVVVYRDETELGVGGVPRNPPVPDLEEPYATAMQELVEDVRAHSADIASFTAEMLRRLNRTSSNENAALFRDWMSSPLAKAQTAQTLLAGARIPARIANGVRLADQVRQATVEPWLEVYNGQQWLYFDPSSGEQYLPENFLVWWYGEAPLLEVAGARDEQVELSVMHNVVDSLEVAERRAALHKSNLYRFSLFNLPIRTQAVYGVLLMVPIGALVLVFMRNVIGVPTFGTFTPVLVALAFRETKLLYGVILFSLVVALGLSVRFYFEKLRLLLVPRLASVLTVVVLLLVAISVVSHELKLETGLSVALFPMVILTMVIERMSITWEERGAGEAMVEGVGSLAVATAAYLLMSVDRVEHVLFVFPELLLVVLALTLMLGRYKGYRLSELLRFKAFVKD